MLCNSITFRGGKAWEISSHAVTSVSHKEDRQDQCLLYHLKCGEEGLDIGVCVKHHRFVQASTVFVNLNLVSKVKGGLFCKCTFDL